MRTLRGSGVGLCEPEGFDRKSMYTPYLMCAYATALLLVLLGFRVIRRSAPDLGGLAYLRQFILCALCGVVLLALRSRAPAILTVVTANFLLLAGVVFLYCAAAEILAVRRRFLPWAVSVCAAALPALLWFTYGSDLAKGRLEVHCLALIAMFTMISVTLFGQGNAALRYPAHACGWLMNASIVLNAAWGAFALGHRPNPNFMHPDGVDAAFSYLSMIVGLGNVVSLAWLSLCVHRQELQATAQTDSLTGLLNRGAFEEILRRELVRSATSKSLLGILLLDIDYFKQVNDEHGHLVGDDVLRGVGAALRRGTRPSDLLARFGGEEFVILLRDAGLEQSEEVAERLRGDIEALRDLPAGVNLTASFGVAVNAPGETAGEFLHRADQALYRSKRDGRNLVTVHRSAGRESVTRR